MGQSNSSQNRRSREQAPQRRTAALRPVSTIFSRQRPDSASQPRPRSIQIPNSTPRPWSPHPRALSPASRRNTRLTRARSSFVETCSSVLRRRRAGNREGPVIRPDPLNSLPQQDGPSPEGNDGPNLPLHLPEVNLNFEPETSERTSPPYTRRIEPRQRPVSNLEYFRRGGPHQYPRPMTNIADRIQSLTPARELTRLTASFRRRAMRRRPAEDNSQMLTRLLSLAAAATAASLMGDRNDTAMNNLRNAAEAVDGDDGTFDGFLQALRSGRLAQHLGQNDNAATSDGDQTPRNPASLDFFRMFRFGSGDRRRNADSSSPTSDNNRPFSESTSGTGQGEDNMGENGNRMIPILIVGIRSLNSTGEGGGDPSDAMPSFLDALTNLPATTNIGLSNQGPLQNFRQARGLRSDRRRRASMGGLNLFPGDHHDHEPLGRRNLSGRPRPQSEIIEGSTGSSTPTGPYPPPTTPLSPPLSVPSTGTSTPSRRASLNFPSAGSSTSAPGHPNSHTPSRTNRSSTLDPTAEEPSPLTSPRRRMSDSTHHFRRRSRDSRRYGLVGAPAFEGDNRVSNSDSPTQATEGNRSWIIYVLGGSYPENHPILTTPSLFTDSPTYEDMLLLSSLLGPAKPPVANAEDVASAGGLLTIVAEDGRLFAQAVENEIERLPIIPGENCLVCLSPYVAGETARRLKTCAHLFHRECIDQWLTTGRNSCPLCRSQGVSESETTKSAATGPDPESPGEGPSARPASMAI